MKVNIRRIVQQFETPGVYLIWADAFEGWRTMGYDKWSVIQSNWAIWHGLGMWKWYRTHPDEMFLRLQAKDELDAFQKVANWDESNNLGRP
jgi:hypothetical protein